MCSSSLMRIPRPYDISNSDYMQQHQTLWLPRITSWIMERSLNRLSQSLHLASLHSVSFSLTIFDSSVREEVSLINLRKTREDKNTKRLLTFAEEWKYLPLRNLILMRSCPRISSCVLQFLIKRRLGWGFLPSRKSLQNSKRVFTWTPRTTDRGGRTVLSVKGVSVTDNCGF